MRSRFDELARTALAEITPATSVGELVHEVDESEGVVTLQYRSLLDGYPSWLWTVSVAQVDGEEPTVLEAELMPGEGALLAPDWVPWSERLAEYEAAKASEAADDEDDDSDEDDEALDDDSEDDESEDDDSDDDDSEDDDLGSDILHGGDLDGVDIDEPEDDESEGDDSHDDDSEDDDEPDDDSDDDESDEDDAPAR